MTQDLYPCFTSFLDFLTQDFPVTEEEFRLYVKFITYEYTEDKLKLSIFTEHSKTRYGVVVKMADETSCKSLKIAIRKAQEYLIFKTKDQLCNLL